MVPLFQVRRQRPRCAVDYLGFSADAVAPPCFSRFQPSSFAKDYDVCVYGAIVPKESECTNLLVTFAVSASHVAFGSIRMEPTFMMLSQSAATAACQMIDQGTTIQNIDYTTLRTTILADGQILSLPKSQ